MKLESSDRTLRQILNTYFFFIPRFQRPYSWELENVEELWEDAIQESAGDYFIGSMVVYPHGEDTVAVIDGQQRLTTLMMLLCALRDAAETHGHAGLADGTHTFVERTDENANDRFVINTETSFPFLHDEILSRGSAQLNATVGSEERAIRAAYLRLQKYVAATVATVKGDPTVPEEAKAEAVGAALKEVRDKVLNLRLILVEVGDQDDATTIFVTLNSRGKDLEPADLVKAHLLQLLPKRTHLDRPRLKWESIVDKFNASQVQLNMTDFLLAVWRSRYGATTEKKLHKAVRKEVKRKQAAAFLDELVADADLYRQVNEPDYRSWAIEERDAHDSLAFFREFGIRQPMPLLLSLMREFDSERIGVKQLRRALRAIEDYHFTWNVLANKTSTGGMSLFFGRRARDLRDAKDANARGRVLTEFIGELKSRRPSEPEFNEAFGSLWFTGERTADKKVVQYVLRRLYRHHSPTTAVEFQHLTVEHLSSQGDASAEAGRLGNLILVTDALNGKLANRKWAEKKAVLDSVTDQWVPPDVSESAVWRDEEIRARTARLAELGRTKIWSG